jgi:hypothetical protein
MTEIVKAGENLFLALGFPPHEAEILQLRAELMGHLRLWIQDNELTQSDAAERLGITQARVSDLAFLLPVPVTVHQQASGRSPLALTAKGVKRVGANGNDTDAAVLDQPFQVLG